MKILLVDDNRQNRYLTASLLQHCGHQVLSAANGAEALTMMNNEGADIIISDILMPEMDGFQLCKKIRESCRWNDVPFIFYTGTYTKEEDEHLALKLGADKYVRKPVEPARLLELLEEITTELAARGRSPAAARSETDEELMTVYSERLRDKLEQKIEELKRETGEHDKARIELAEANRALRSLIDCNRAMMRAEDESDLTDSVCRIITQNRKYRFAWIGLTEAAEGGALQRATWSTSPASDELTAAQVQALEQRSVKQSLAALERGEPVTLRDRDFPVNPGAATKRKSSWCSVSLPLFADGAILGAITIHSEHAGILEKKELNLLKELANDLAFGIHALRIRAERKRVEQALRTSEQRLELAIRGSQGGIWDLELTPGTGRRKEPGNVFISPSLKRFIGFEDQEFPSSLEAWQERIHPEDLEGFRQNVKAALQAKTERLELEYRIRHKDGGMRRIRSCGAMQRDSSGKPVRWSGIDWDVTDQYHAEEQQRELITVIEQSATAVLIADKDGIMKYVNPEFERLSGFSRQEVLGQSYRMLKSDMHSEDFYRQIYEALAAGKVWAGRYSLRTKGGSSRLLETTLSPVLDRSGSVIDFICVNRDVTHEAAIEDQLRQAQKVEAIGTLAAGIAHDFNNVLGGIIGYTELVMYQLQEGAQARLDLEQVLKACYRAKELIKQILVFSRRDEQIKKPVDISLLVKEALKMLRASLPATIEIVPRLHCECATVLADPTQLHQVLVNLFTNAAHAVSEMQGVVEVELSNTFLDREDLVYFPELSAGNYLKISVKDNGEGIEAQNLSKIFDPYFTTKRKDEGTGLGLAVVQGIIEKHKGAIRVQSELGKGSTFEIYLSLIEGESKLEIDSAINLPSGSERILMVDDEPTLITLAKQMLERLGYRVDTAAGGVEALEMFLKNPDGFDLIITDYTMPYLTGEGLAREVLEVRPDLPIILCTGYSKRIDEARAKEIGICRFILKPLAMRELATAVRLTLDEKKERSKKGLE